jgi:hypothetical protein
MDSEGSRNLIPIVVMVLLYAALVFSKTRKSSKGAKK